jgi:GNAT superfamily N-acetyltransferase
VSVRRLKVGDDLTAAIDLLQQFFREEGFDTPDAVIAKNTQRMAGVDVCGLFVAEHDGLTIGVATVSLEFGIEFGWSAEMGDLYVIQEHRGKGVSRELVMAVEDYLRSKGASGYQVTVTPYAEEHHAMRAFYAKLGFVDDGRVLLFKTLSAGPSVRLNQRQT